MKQIFEEFLTVSNANVPISAFILNIILSVFLGFLLSLLYLRYGNSLSNRRHFGKNFLLISTTTMLIIAVIKSSLALSLGLVGAMSIIRFRTAIKEPEELTYLYISVAIGLGLGADRPIITILSFLIISIIIISIKKFSKKDKTSQNMYFTIRYKINNKITTDDIFAVLKKNFNNVSLRRLYETKKIIEVSFIVATCSFAMIDKAKKELQQMNNTLKITFQKCKNDYTSSEYE